MKKYYLAIIIAFSTFFCTVTALADTLQWAAIGYDGDVTVNIVSDLSEEQLYTIYLTEQDTVLSGETGEKQLNDLIRLEQITIPEQKEKRYSSAALNMNMPFAADGQLYKITIGGGELDGKTLFAVYPTKAIADKAADALATADKSTIGSVLEEYQNKAWVLDLDNDIYKNCSDEVKSKLVSIIKEGGASAEKVGVYFVNACILTELAHCDETDFYNKLLRSEYSLNMTFSDEVYSEKESIAKAFVNLRSDSTLDSISELESLIHKAEALGVLNDATRENLLSVLTEYNDVFNLDFDGDYKTVDSYSVVKKMVAGSNPYKSISAVKAAFDETVASLVSKNNTIHSGGGGNGSSGGGSYKPSVSGNVFLPTGNYVTVDMVENVLGTKSAFKDIGEAQWAENYINYLKGKNIIVGDGNGYVRPNEAIKREEFVKILIEAVKSIINEEKEGNETLFNDVDENEWYAPYISTAVKSGIVKGISDSDFGIGMKITRQDAAVMIYRAVESCSEILKETAKEDSFSDEADISDYAVNPVKTMQRAGIIAGYETGEFLPKNPVTRAETAKMIYSTLSSMNKL